MMVTKDNEGQQRTTKDNEGQRRTTKDNDYFVPDAVQKILITFKKRWGRSRKINL